MGIRVKRAAAAVDDMRDADNAAAKEAKMRADLDYVAMMADVDLPEDDEEGQDEAE